MATRKHGTYSHPLSADGREPLTEIGYVEYPTLLHALWREGLSIIRSWRYAQSIGGKRTLFWYGVYRTGTEVRIAATGPHGISVALTLSDTINRDSGSHSKSRDVQQARAAGWQSGGAAASPERRHHD